MPNGFHCFQKFGPTFIKNLKSGQRLLQIRVAFIITNWQKQVRQLIEIGADLLLIGAAIKNRGNNNKLVHNRCDTADLNTSFKIK